MNTLHLSHSGRSEQGRRSSNDDAILSDEQAGLYIVCDGTRGRFGGHTAGGLAVHAIQARLAQYQGRLPAAIDASAEQLVNDLVSVGHAEIRQAQASDHSLAGMATTYASVLWRPPEILVSHVGDTRVYVWRDGALHQLTVDHNLENYIKQNPSFKPQVRCSGKTLVRVLGLKAEPPVVEHLRVAVQSDDLLLISTDGLTDSMPEVTLSTMLAQVNILPVDEIAGALTRAALNHGSMDNISLILLHASDKPSAGDSTTLYEAGSRANEKQLVGWLVFLDKPHTGRIVPLDASTVVGAETSCKVVLTEDYISSRHAEILRTSHGFILEDLGSTNGTFLNNIKVVDSQSLVDGDRVRMGRTEMIFKSHVVE